MYGAGGDRAQASPEWRLRLQARLERRLLDRQIARGAALDRSPARALRARQLGSTSERRAVAACLVNVLEAVEECEADSASPLVLDRRAVIEARVRIIALIERLRDDRPAEPRGVALARVLTDSANSPLFGTSSRQTLQQALEEIADALES